MERLVNVTFLEREGCFMGYRVEGSNLYVGEIFVHPDYRGKGLAVKLLDDSIKLAKEFGCKQVYGDIDLENGSKSEIAALTLKCGFKILTWEDRTMRVVKEVSNE